MINRKENLADRAYDIALAEAEEALRRERESGVLYAEMSVAI